MQLKLRTIYRLLLLKDIILSSKNEIKYLTRSSVGASFNLHSQISISFL